MPNLFNARTIQHLNYSGQKFVKQYAFYDSDTPMALKQGQGHQTWYILIDLEQGYNNTKFEKPRLNSVGEKADDEVFVNLRNTPIISLEYVRKSKTMIYS